MGLKECFTISKVFILMALPLLDLGIGTYADHTASETMNNQCSIVCPRAQSCQLTSLSGRSYLQCTGLGGTYQLHPYAETRPTSRIVDRKQGRINNAYRNVIGRNQILIGNRQQQRENLPDNMPQPQAIGNDADLSRLLNFSPFGRNMGANTARTNERTRQNGLTTRQRVDERRANSIDPVASRIRAGLRNALQSQFGPPTRELPEQGRPPTNELTEQFRPPTTELPGASPDCQHCDTESNCTTARPICFHSTTCARRVCQSKADITSSST